MLYAVCSPFKAQGVWLEGSEHPGEEQSGSSPVLEPRATPAAQCAGASRWLGELGEQVTGVWEQNFLCGTVMTMG